MNTIKKPHASTKKYKYQAKDGTVVELTPQQKAYADAKLAAKPGTSLVQAAKAAYPNANYDTLRQAVARNEHNLSIAIYSREQVSRAKSRIAELVDSPREDIALRSSQDILDREHGKAIQQVNTRSESLSIVIDLSGGETPQQE